MINFTQRNTAGFLIGHADNEATGVTVILAPKGAVGGVDVRGGAPGTRETDLLRGANQVKKIHAVTLCGGSAFGLEACCGVMEWLYSKNIGFKTATHCVPIVTGAVLYDLSDPKVLNYPTKEMGKIACENAVPISKAAHGRVGAGKGATVGKIRGLKYACVGGLGIATCKWMGTSVTAVVAVNALGDVYDESTGEILAGAKDKDGNFIDTQKTVVEADWTKLVGGSNTTIGCILTDAKLNREEANKIASVAHDGLARSIRPIHTMADGDTIFCMSSGHKRPNFIALCAVAAEVMRFAVTEAVK